MRIAYLILVHTNPNQVNMLIDRLDNGKNIFFVHVDKKCEKVFEKISKKQNVHFVADRTSVTWGGYSLVDASIKLMRMALKFEMDFDYAVLLSGQDYPIKSNEYIESFFEKNKGKEYFKVRPLPYKRWVHHNGGLDRFEVPYAGFMIGRTARTWRMRTSWVKVSRKIGIAKKRTLFKEYYGISQWFCTSQKALRYLIEYVDQNWKQLGFFRRSFIPDEIFFNTIIMNSPFKDRVVPTDLRFVEWTNTAENPRVWRIEDVDTLCESDRLFARKFDERIDNSVFKELDARVK